MSCLWSQPPVIGHASFTCPPAATCDHMMCSTWIQSPLFVDFLFPKALSKFPAFLLMPGDLGTSGELVIYIQFYDYNLLGFCRVGEFAMISALLSLSDSVCI